MTTDFVIHAKMLLRLLIQGPDLQKFQVEGRVTLDASIYGPLDRGMVTLQLYCWSVGPKHNPST